MKVVYDETPEQMAHGVVPLLQAGANIIGACCGSTPDHIRAFRAAMAQLSLDMKIRTFAPPPSRCRSKRRCATPTAATGDDSCARSWRWRPTTASSDSARWAAAANRPKRSSAR